MSDEAITIGVRGLHCAGCVARLERVLARLPGVDRAEVSLFDASARLTASPGAVVDAAAAARAIEDAGFYAVAAEGSPSGLRS